MKKTGETLEYGYAPFQKDWIFYLADSDDAVRKISIGRTKRGLLKEAKVEYSQYTLKPSKNPLTELIKTLTSYTQAKPSIISGLVLAQQGTAFQNKVWERLTKIPRGEVRTYTQVAKMVGKPSAVRAVASACARNNIALLVPCHRVVRADGLHSKYRWGDNYKRILLEIENNK